MGLLGGATQLLGGVALLLVLLLGGVTPIIRGGHSIISAIIRGGSPHY